ncbi:unnamed protein product [Brassica rapa]|uniref:Uncharacterized protein n=1 Tax=Brassica campestris TaxID=3711 RepID=A0A3P6CDN6_BRACM|nr:unnamed protein product [Brassica rapa]VDD12480.1 unnamed protein product [Brassica rapa]
MYRLQSCQSSDNYIYSIEIHLFESSDQKSHSVVRREYKKGLWTVEEDKILMDYVRTHGQGHWNRIAKKTGLKRCGKSCRLRWMNYLSPSVNRGNFTDQEEDLIIRLHKLLGNRWSLIAKRVPGRTDNQVKNYWNTHLSKKLGLGDHSYEAKPACDTETPASLVITTTKTSSPPSLVVTTTTSHQDVGDEKVSTLRFDTTDDDSKLNTKSKPVYSIQPDAEVAATIPNLFDTFWVLEDNFDLSSLTMMDFANGYCL